MNLKFWTWGRPRAPAGPADPGDTFAWFTIGVGADGSMASHARFPTENRGDATALVKNFALLLYMLNSGKLLGSIKRGVALGGEAGPVANQFAHMVMAKLNDLSVDSDTARGPRRDRLVVRPRDTFGYNTRPQGDHE